MIKNLALAATAAVFVGLSGCTVGADPDPVPVSTTVSERSTTPTTRPAPTTTSRVASTTKASVATRKSTVVQRSAPTAGYQCRDGDEKHYEVCAGHKEWVDGQVEFAECHDNGGTWSVRGQRCVYPSK